MPTPSNPRAVVLSSLVYRALLRTCPRRFQLQYRKRWRWSSETRAGKHIANVARLVWSWCGARHSWISGRIIAEHVTSGLISLTTQWLPFEVVPAATAMSNPIGVRANLWDGAERSDRLM